MMCGGAAVAVSSRWGWLNRSAARPIGECNAASLRAMAEGCHCRRAKLLTARRGGLHDGAGREAVATTRPPSEPPSSHPAIPVSHMISSARLRGPGSACRSPAADRHLLSARPALSLNLQWPQSPSKPRRSRRAGWQAALTTGAAEAAMTMAAAPAEALLLAAAGAAVAWAAWTLVRFIR